ncbi:helix-turn-helix transcriptional regulator [Paenibacillus antri]|uniref:Helix-turn-helix transcriptional regulator n=1 Tax=Paenibacillus antri TaxID=2582848 RepID=A0A5R9GBF1_9BACL|nr:AraC family transcriptional regulator [Paenibacillus antri]TLS50043.1 helix-turn-helix transcriptional regulator [Paenibacillus antri]
MPKLRRLRQIRMRSNSLFLRLVAGFLCIILLLVCLTSYALSVSKSNVRHEIVKYNTLMLRNTMENYENHFEIITKQMYFFYFSDNVQRLQSDPRYTFFPKVISDILTWVGNPNLYINNIVFYAQNSELGRFAVEKGTSSSNDTMFKAFMASERYPLEFWEQQFNESYTQRMFPADTFYSNIFEGRKETLGNYIPMVFKRADNHDFYMVVFLDAAKMYNAFHQASNDDLVIYDGRGQVIYNRAANEEYPALEELASRNSAFIQDDKYHFYMKDPSSGLTYLHRLPAAQLASQTQLNFTVVVVVIAVIALSVVMSLFLAARINNPFRKLIDSIRGPGEGEQYRSSIREFDIIGSQLRDKNRLMKQWAFLNHLKDIRDSEYDRAKLEFIDKPYVFVLFHVIEKNNAAWPEGTFQSWLYYMKVFIEDKLNRSFPDALTFQTEYNQILSMVFIEDGDELHALLRDMKAVFDQDRDSGTITIAVTSTYDSSDQMNAAYREVRERIEERLLVDETQIVSAAPTGPVELAFTQEQDVQFRANIREGNEEAASNIVRNFFSEWRSPAATAATWHRFAERVEERIRLAALERIGLPRLDEILANSADKISRCVTVAELERQLLEWVTLTAHAVQEKKAEPKDAVTSFVIDYVQNHMAEEIYLDALAEKLNLSSGYLSSYFKEKTGTNIVEYVNETRIRKAAELLLDTRMKVQEVAEAVGYRNITSFNRMFKKYTGLRPSDYRKGDHDRPDGETTSG